DPPTLADVNNDGVPDLVTCRDPQANYPSHDQTPVVSIYLGAGDGSFPLAHTYTPYPDGSIVFPNWRGTSFAGGGYCTVLGFNQDEKPDIAVFQHDSHGYPYNGFLQYLIGNGDGSFVPSYDTFRFDKPGIPEFAFDIDGNGSIDWLESDTYDASFNYLPAAAG